MPKFSDLAHLPPAQGDAGADVPMYAYVLWRTLHEALDAADPPPDEHAPGGVPGRVWKGSLTAALVALWPHLAEWDEARRAVGDYLRETENLQCVKGGRVPHWWVRTEWHQVDVIRPHGFQAVVKPARHRFTELGAGPPPEPAPVTSRWQCGSCPFSTGSADGMDYHRMMNGHP